MSTGIDISSNATPRSFGRAQYSVLGNAPPPRISTTSASSLIFNALSSENQSLTGGVRQEPEIRILPTNINLNLTSAASIESQNLTSALDQKPEVLLPQDVVAQIHSVNVIDANAVPIQIWEGCVQSVNKEDGTMKASLTAKMGIIPEHVGKIDLQWVPEQDADLVKPGAVFYLTLFKRVRRGGSIENSQAIQFRRRPNWSKSQLDKINDRANTFLSKIKSKPIAD